MLRKFWKKNKSTPEEYPLLAQPSFIITLHHLSSQALKEEVAVPINNRAQPKKITIEEKSTPPLRLRDPLSTLPTDILRKTLFGFLTPLERAEVAMLNQQFHSFPEYKNEIKNALKQLLQFVAYGDKNQAETLISQCPELLLHAGQTSDYSFYYRHGQYYPRKLQGTALQIALGAEDINLYDQSGKKLLGEGMVEMIMRHLKKLPNGKVVIVKQILKQFPSGWENREEKEHARRLSALHEVGEVIKFSHNNEACLNAVLKFKNALAPLVPQEMIISSGKHWDARLLQAALEMGYDLFNDDGFDSSDPRKADLFYKEIIGHIEALAPANYAMAIAQGLKPLLEDKNNFKRDLNYRIGTGHYYPVSASDVPRLGAGSWVDCFFGKRVFIEASPSVVKEWCLPSWLKHLVTIPYRSGFFDSMLAQKEKIIAATVKRAHETWLHEFKHKTLNGPLEQPIRSHGTASCIIRPNVTSSQQFIIREKNHSTVTDFAKFRG